MSLLIGVALIIAAFGFGWTAALYEPAGDGRLRCRACRGVGAHALGCWRLRERA